MKNTITILALMISFNCLGQAPQGQIKTGDFKSSYFEGDTIDIRFNLIGGASNWSDSIIVQYYGKDKDNNDNTILWARIKPKDAVNVGDTSGYTYHYKLILPKGADGSRYAQINSGTTPIFTVSPRVAAIINPTLPENRNNEFDFYNQIGIFQNHCKYSDLSPGFYISNGFKFIKE